MSLLHSLTHALGRHTGGFETGVITEIFGDAGAIQIYEILYGMEVVILSRLKNGRELAIQEMERFIWEPGESPSDGISRFIGMLEILMEQDP